jgi:2-polyprenyl-3-methyl-5-hydroxy-6-metoxy-1,4-benzoquinol methylase
MKDNSIKKIKDQFNSEKRIEEMLVSYDVKSQNQEVERDPFEKLREELIFNLVQEYNLNGSKKILDIGCGIGGFILRCLQSGIDAQGIDCAESMISLAKSQLQNAGHDEKRVFLHDILEYQSLEKYNILTAIGVIWYYNNKQRFLKKMYELLLPGGVVMVVHRNALFNLFAMNQGTLNFFSEHLLTHLSEGDNQNILSSIETAVSGLSEPIIKHTSSALNKSYENPLDIKVMYMESGFEVIDLYYAYLHPTPPRLKIQHSDETYRLVHNKYHHSWHGMFLGSQFVVIAKKNNRS